MFAGPGHAGGDDAELLARKFRQSVQSGRIDRAIDLQHRLWSADPGLSLTRPAEIPLLAWSREYAPADRDRFLFVSGAPRSGTTALGRILNAHEDVALYTELYPPRFGCLPAMFAAGNIDKLYAHGHLPSLDRHGNADLHERSGAALWVGDKSPNFMRSVELTIRHFSARSLTIVHIVRGVYDVAHSYLERVRTGTFPPSRDHARGRRSEHEQSKGVGHSASAGASA